MSSLVCLLYILYKVASVLLVNPGNNEIVGGDCRVTAREADATCGTENEKDK
jgi:hypothetical protein